MPSLLEQAISTIRTGELTRAQQLLAQYLQTNPNDQNAWLWMTRCVATPEQKKYCFERVLKMDPQNQNALEALRRLGAIENSAGGAQPVLTTSAQSHKQSTSKNGTVMMVDGALTQSEHTRGVSHERNTGPLDLVLKVAPFVAAGYYYLLLSAPVWPTPDNLGWAVAETQLNSGLPVSDFLVFPIFFGEILVGISLFLAIASLFVKYLHPLPVGTAWIVLAIVLVVPPVVLGLHPSPLFGSLWTTGTRGLVGIGVVYCIVGLMMLSGMGRTKPQA